MATVIRKPGSGLAKLQQNINNLQNMRQASWADLFNPGFMRKHTDHQSMEAMFGASGYKIGSKEDVSAIPDDEWNAFVKKTTQFSSWDEMQLTAARELTAAKLLAGIK